MAKKHKKRKSKNTSAILKAFVIVIVLMVGFICFHYYRRYTRQAEMVRQEQIQRQQDEEKQLKQKKEFINEIGPIAREVDKSYDLLPSITIAQACLESNYGQSDLAKKYNNLFGVKGSNPNTSAVLNTKEYVKGKWITVKARFQIYDSLEASIRAHARLFQKGTSWNEKQYQHVLAAKNYKEQAKALVTDGYATDPDYSSKLINLIQQFDLEKYDK